MSDLGAIRQGETVTSAFSPTRNGRAFDPASVTARAATALGVDLGALVVSRRGVGVYVASWASAIDGPTGLVLITWTLDTDDDPAAPPDGQTASGIDTVQVLPAETGGIDALATWITPQQVLALVGETVTGLQLFKAAGQVEAAAGITAAEQDQLLGWEVTALKQAVLWQALHVRDQGANEQGQMLDALRERGVSSYDQPDLKVSFEASNVASKAVGANAAAALLCKDALAQVRTLRKFNQRTRSYSVSVHDPSRQRLADSIRDSAYSGSIENKWGFKP